MVAEFTSDVGRKMFGFSHEEMDNSTAYYEGHFKMNMRQGEGVLHAPASGAKYVGQFQADRYHGYGDNAWSDGSRYRGQWVRGQKYGQGEYTSADELKYTGRWENGVRHGTGTQEYANSDWYDGGWFKGLCSGRGVYHFADGSKYEGTWAHGRYDGPGLLHCANGTCERHRYSCGLLVKREVLPLALGRSSFGKALTGKADLSQTREQMHKPTVRAKNQMSRYLINREMAGVDLSAPPLWRTSPEPCALEGEVVAALEDSPVEPRVVISEDGDLQLQLDASPATSPRVSR